LIFNILAKIKHTNSYDVVDHVFTAAKAKKIMHLSLNDEAFEGDFLKINEQELINFGTCGYLGLEKHPHVLAKSHELLDKFGSHFSISRAFVKASYLEELENLISTIFDNHPVIVYTSTSIAHQSIIGTIIEPNDLIILDQQVHYSVQYPSQFAKLQGTMVKMIRHNNMEMLEDFIKRGYNQYDKIWYMADGVYSMYGDVPHKKELRYLLEKYPKLHLYFDDAHGVGWTGTNGCGSIFEYFKDSDRVVLISTLAKGFGSIGGIAIFNDVEMYRRIDIYGGILSYTHPLSPANVGAAIGSAELFLSDNIVTYQSELKALMHYLDKKLEELNLPNTSSNETPIYFIGTGAAKVTHNLIQKVIADGLYVNTATYPVVPSDKTGLRFTLTRHNTKEHIDKLVNSIDKNFSLAVEEENEDLEKIYKNFNIPFKGKNIEKQFESAGVFVEIYRSINEIDSELWNNLFENNGNYSHNGLRCIEEIFSDNTKKEENWDFYYLIIKDTNDEVIIATYFTSAIYKDDMLALENVSRQIERQREEEPYYLCSKTLAMGSLFTEGEHLYVKNDHPLLQVAFNHFFVEIEKLKKETNSVVVILRDFQSDFQFHERFEAEGFTKVDMPNTNIVTHPKWKTKEELLSFITSKNSINNIKRYVFKYEDQFDVSIKKTLTDEEAEKHYQLFTNVKKANYAFNFFAYPQKITKILSKYKEWEFIEFRLKGSDELIACIWHFVGGNHSCPLIVGLNYDYIKSHHLYKQVMYYMVKRGNDLGKSKIYLGLTSDYEKQKYDAKLVSVSGYIKVDNMYNLELIESYSNVNN
jgi:7-keto-8-aminopelargonate synthetase-like enzyme